LNYTRKQPNITQYFININQNFTSLGIKILTMAKICLIILLSEV